MFIECLVRRMANESNFRQGDCIHFHNKTYISILHNPIIIAPLTNPDQSSSRLRLNPKTDSR